MKILETIYTTIGGLIKNYKYLFEQPYKFIMNTCGCPQHMYTQTNYIGGGVDKEDPAILQTSRVEHLAKALVDNGVVSADVYVPWHPKYKPSKLFMPYEPTPGYDHLNDEYSIGMLAQYAGNEEDDDTYYKWPTLVDIRKHDNHIDVRALLPDDHFMTKYVNKKYWRTYVFNIPSTDIYEKPNVHRFLNHPVIRYLWARQKSPVKIQIVDDFEDEDYLIKWRKWDECETYK